MTLTPNWEFGKEYVEKGISGFKVKAKDREILELLKDDALKNEFDILLCFMFDRIGRSEEETPYVVKFFIDNNIEVWSVKEGQRKLENHVDNLLNYITFWQASGESKKTQQRTLAAKEQIRNEGRSQGCAAAYGYKHISTGEHNAKGREIKKLVINEEEAEVVKQIFNLSSIKGYGSRRIAKELNNIGIKTKTGKLWAGGTVMGILKNSLYKGYFMYGRYKMDGNKRVYRNQHECETSDKKYDDLVIVSEKQWEEVQKIIQSRSGKLESNIPKQTKSPLLFTGFIYCGNCGHRLTLHYSYTHYKRKDGTMSPENRKSFYVCYGSENGMCNKQKGYSSEKLERTIIKLIYKYLENLKVSDMKEEILLSKKNDIKKCENDIFKKKEEITKLEKDIKLLKDEILKVIRGESLFTPELLNEQIKENNNKLLQLKQNLTKFEGDLETLKNDSADYLAIKESLLSWIPAYEKADNETRKMLLAKIVDRIDVSGTHIKLALNMKTSEGRSIWSSNNSISTSS